jgi:AbrB family looped-hinge helix DNA binding protein
MDVGIIRVSSKGQIVIPSHMRKDLREGDQLLIIREGERFVLKPLDKLEPALREDILFAEQTERAFAEYTSGTYSRKNGSDFLEELALW